MQDRLLALWCGECAYTFNSECIVCQENKYKTWILWVFKETFKWARTNYKTKIYWKDVDWPAVDLIWRYCCSATDIAKWNA